MGNQLKDEGAKHFCEFLKENSTLKTLEIGLHILYDEFWSVNCLFSLKNYDKKGRNDIGDEGAKHLFQFLKGNSTLTSLDLGLHLFYFSFVNFNRLICPIQKNMVCNGKECNNFGVEGAKYLCEYLATNSSLTSLELRLNISISNFFLFMIFNH